LPAKTISLSMAHLIWRNLSRTIPSSHIRCFDPSPHSHVRLRVRLPNPQDHFTTGRLLGDQGSACAANGITKLDPSTRSKSEPRFVNSALSATLRTYHPSYLRGMLGHLVQDGLESFGKLHELFGPDAKENIWNEVFTDYAIEGGGLWKLFADLSRGSHTKPIIVSFAIRSIVTIFDFLLLLFKREEQERLVGRSFHRRRKTQTSRRRKQ
jgi:hypothetical protein